MMFSKKEMNILNPYLHTARYLSVARLMVRNVVQDIRMFFRGYLNINTGQFRSGDISQMSIYQI